MPERSAGTHHIKSEQNVNMLLFWLDCANFTVNIHCGVQGSHGTEGLFRQWINIDIWLNWCIRKNSALERHTFMPFLYLFKMWKISPLRSETSCIAPSPKEKQVRDSGSWLKSPREISHSGKSEASRGQMGGREARMTTFHQKWCLMVKELLREDFPFAVSVCCNDG